MVKTHAVTSLSLPLDSDVEYSYSDVIGEILYRQKLSESDSDNSSDELQ